MGATRNGAGGVADRSVSHEMGGTQVASSNRPSALRDASSQLGFKRLNTNCGTRPSCASLDSAVARAACQDMLAVTSRTYTCESFLSETLLQLACAGDYILALLLEQSRFCPGEI